MKSFIAEIQKEVYDKCGFKLSKFSIEKESKEYDACRFELNGQRIIYRNGKVTPKKVGQFVTFWKRDGHGPIQPFDASDEIDYFVVNVETEKHSGQFVFPKAELIKRGILSTASKEGKRAFRVYPIWDTVTSKQAERSQKWQLRYFFAINAGMDIQKVVGLFES